MYSIYFLVVLLIKNSSISLVLIGSISYIGMNILSSEFNPFIYTDIHKIITRETAALTYNPAISFSDRFKTLFINWFYFIDFRLFNISI